MQRTMKSGITRFMVPHLLFFDESARAIERCLAEVTGYEKCVAPLVEISGRSHALTRR